MATLRSRQGCPWDREQTHASLRPFLLEETYEALDAIDRGDLDDLRGEIGDVLFQCVFHSQLAAETGTFDAGDAILAVIAKLVRRHPHVFTAAGRTLPRARAAAARRSSAKVVEQWEHLKAREQSARGAAPRVLSGIPRAMPALLRAHEIGTRAAAVGFDWPDAAGVLAKVEEEVAELRAAMALSPERQADEMGDILFSIANLARRMGIEPESALRGANDKFTRRFDRVEASLESAGASVHQASLPEMERAWEQAKRDTSSL